MFQERNRQHISPFQKSLSHTLLRSIKKTTTKKKTHKRFVEAYIYILMSSSGGGVLGGELNTTTTNNNNEKTKNTNTNISEETTPTEVPESSSPNNHQNQSNSENSSSTGGDFMSDWKSFAAKATSSFNEASQSISETLRESGVNDVVASTTTNVKFYANSAYDMSANAASNAAESRPTRRRIRCRRYKVSIESASRGAWRLRSSAG